MVARLYLTQRLFNCLGATVTVTQCRAIKGIIVDTIYIADEVIEAIVAYSGTSGIESLSQVVKCLHIVALCRVTCHIWYPPALIERDPHYNTGVVVVTCNHLHPFACQPLDR